MGELGELPSVGSCRVGHDWGNLAAAAEEEEEKKKGYEKIFEEIIDENFPNMEEEVIVSHSQSVQEVQSPIQDKPKEKHTKTHTNQTAAAAKLL